MRAIVQNAYGSPDVLELKDVAKPAVNENDVLVRVHAAALNAGDVFSMRGRPLPIRFMVGFPKPKDYILGWDAAGTVEAVGKNVTQFRPGDEVYGACKGAFAEYACAGEEKWARKPTNLTFEQAATVPTAAVSALRGLRDIGNLQTGQKVLINGASGGVGTFAVQVAKALGAEVTGVCSTGKVEMVHSLGAKHVIDYTQENFTQSGPVYDLILDNVANHSFADLRRALTPQGIIVPNSGHSGLGYVLKAILLAPFMSQQGPTFVASPNSEDLVALKELIEAGKITPVIDRTYPLSETPEAIRYLDEDHARGKVIITV